MLVARRRSAALGPPQVRRRAPHLIPTPFRTIIARTALWGQSSFRTIIAAAVPHRNRTNSSPRSSLVPHHNVILCVCDFVRDFASIVTLAACSLSDLLGADPVPHRNRNSHSAPSFSLHGGRCAPNTEVSFSLHGWFDFSTRDKRPLHAGATSCAPPGEG